MVTSTPAALLRCLMLVRECGLERLFEELLEDLDKDPAFCLAFPPLISEDGPDDWPAPDDCPDPELIEPLPLASELDPADDPPSGPCVRRIGLSAGVAALAVTADS